MAVLWPDVKDRLVAALPAVLPTVRVYDGPVVTGETPDAYLTVGWQPSTDDESAGSFEQTPGPDGFSAQESGTVLMELAAVIGDTEVPDGFGLADALTAWVHANPTLGGVLSANGTASLAVEVVEAQTTDGATQRLLLTLSYTSLI